MSFFHFFCSYINFSLFSFYWVIVGHFGMKESYLNHPHYGKHGLVWNISPKYSPIFPASSVSLGSTPILIEGIDHNYIVFTLMLVKMGNISHSLKVPLTMKYVINTSFSSSLSECFLGLILSWWENLDNLPFPIKSLMIFFNCTHSSVL